MSLIAAMRRQATAPPQPPAPGYGQLDDVPPPRAPDVTVFGDWTPGEPGVWLALKCPCGCCQSRPGPCWFCGAIVVAGQWL